MPQQRVVNGPSFGDRAAVAVDVYMDRIGFQRFKLAHKPACTCTRVFSVGGYVAVKINSGFVFGLPNCVMAWHFIITSF